MKKLVTCSFILLATATVALCCGNEPRIFVASPDGEVVSFLGKEWNQSEYEQIGEKCILTIRERNAPTVLSCGEEEWEIRKVALDRCFTWSDMAFLWGTLEEEQEQIEKIMKERRK